MKPARRDNARLEKVGVNGHKDPRDPSAGFARNPNEICFNRRGRGGSQRNADAESIWTSLRTSASSVVNPFVFVSPGAICVMRGDTVEKKRSM